MKIFINKEKKKVYFWDVICSIFLVTIVLGGVVYFANPEYKKVQERDKTRKEDLESISTQIQEYTTTNGVENLSLIKGCSEGFTKINETLTEIVAKIPKDPKTQNAYEICTSFDKSRLELTSPDAELEEISLSKQLQIE